MKKIGLASIVLAAVASGCVTQQQQLAQQQPSAVETALQRGRFDMNCPAATATVLSSDYINPAIQGPWVAGMSRVEYTVGVEGCGQRDVYVVICQVGNATCFATTGRGDGPVAR